MKKKLIKRNKKHISHLFRVIQMRINRSRRYYTLRVSGLHVPREIVRILRARLTRTAKQKLAVVENYDAIGSFYTSFVIRTELRALNKKSRLNPIVQNTHLSHELPHINLEPNKVLASAKYKVYLHEKK